MAKFTFICHVCDVSWVFGHKTLRFAQLLTHKEGSIPIRRDPGFLLCKNSRCYCMSLQKLHKVIYYLISTSLSCIFYQKIFAFYSNTNRQQQQRKIWSKIKINLNHELVLIYSECHNPGFIARFAQFTFFF